LSGSARTIAASQNRLAMTARYKDSFLANSYTHNQGRITFDFFMALRARPRIAHSKGEL
jgi:hypothetical protein